MEETLQMCITCLTTDRCLVPVHKLTILLQEIRFEELKKLRGGVCWECWSILAKFYRFKNRAKRAQEILSRTKEHINMKSLTTLTSKINTLYDYQYTYCFDPLTNCDAKLKAEPDLIKQENIDHSDDNLDDTPDLDDKKGFNEAAENVYIDIIEMKCHNNLLRKEDSDNQCDVNFDNFSDSDEKFTETPEDIIEITNKHNNKLLKKQKYHRFVKGVKVKTDHTNDRHKEETKGNDYVESTRKKTKPSKSKRSLERDAEEFQEKFQRVVLSEEQMLRVREEKRNHYNFKKIPYKCDSCVLGFTREETYSLHMRKKHAESIGDEICDVCGIRFRHKPALNNHRMKHYVVYRCRLCKYEIHERMSVVNHCKTKHVADMPDNIHCSQCDIVVKTPEDLEAHTQTVHSLYCECGIKFKDKNNLRRHISRAHSGLRNFICDICKKTFKTKTRLETHMVTHSGNIAMKLAYCQQCKVQYKNIQVYRNHLKASAQHSEGHACSECNKKFRSKGYLRQHFNFYHLRKSQFRCEVCNKIFISNWRLRNHKQQYHGLSRPRNHSCNTCAKKFFTLATLRSHQLIHSDQRSFMCEDCGDTFKQSAALYTHTRLVHKGGGTKKNRDF